MKEYDLICIGGGSGGIATARRAASYRKKVMVCERLGKSGLGGTCVNVGCVPKKLFFEAASLNSNIDEAGHYGFHIENKTFDWAKFKKHRDAYLRRLNTIYETNLEKSDIQVCYGLASLVSTSDSGTVVSCCGEEYLAKHLVLATGGEPSFPKSIKNAREFCIDSDGFFALEKQPKKVCVIGSGYIAVELAGVLHHLGSETHLCVRYNSVLRSFDEIIQQGLMSEFKKQKMEVHTEFVPEEILEDGKKSVKARDGRILSGFDVIIMAVGRESKIEGLKLSNVGLELTNGYVQVDEYQNTKIPGIYCLGDLAGKFLLTPVAIAAGRLLADRLFLNLDRKLEYSNIPTAIFSHPPCATVGLTEAEAREKYKHVEVYKSTFVNLRYGIYQLEGVDKPKTSMKLVCEGKKEVVVGAHVVGLGADEMMQGIAVAVKLGATKAQLDSTIAIHPTAAEEFVTMPIWGMSQLKK